MTTTAQSAQQADATKAIAALRKRLNRWELDHLRHHCADLAQRLDDALIRVDALESEASRAWDAADSWREQATELVNDLHEAGKTVGLTIDGELVVMADQQPAADQNASDLTQLDQYAAGLAVQCFGADSPEALRLAKYIVERSGKKWLTENAPATTAEVLA